VDARERLLRLGYLKQASSIAPTDPSARHEPRGATVERDQVRSRPDGVTVQSRVHPLDHIHAAITLSDALAHRGEQLAILSGDERFRRVDPARLAILDCETTGLSGGTGTLAFLLGVGTFAEGGFRIDQIVVDDPAEERAALQQFAAILKGKDAIVSFNGKTFDWPLLEMRFLYHRLDDWPRAPLHCDLLFPARRIFRRRLGGCALQRLESAVLGLADRDDDIPGWAIPGRYFQYLRSRDRSALEPILAHNAQDILTLTALLVRLGRAVGNPPAPDEHDPCDLVSVAGVLEDAGHTDRALFCLERARAHPGFDDDGLRARAALLYRRLDRRDRAVAIWESLAEAGALSLEPYVELAKRAEHRLRDYALASDLTQRALGVLPRIAAHLPAFERQRVREGLEHRLERVHRRIARRTL